MELSGGGGGGPRLETGTRSTLASDCLRLGLCLFLVLNWDSFALKANVLTTTPQQKFCNDFGYNTRNQKACEKVVNHCILF